MPASAREMTLKQGSIPSRRGRSSRTLSGLAVARMMVRGVLDMGVMSVDDVKHFPDGSWNADKSGACNEGVAYADLFNLFNIAEGAMFS